MTPPEITLVLLHSWGTSAREWDAVRAALETDSVALDLSGFGDAPPRLDEPTVSDYADDVLREVRDLGGFVLVGHSMGGKVAQAIAARRPEGLVGLVLVAPSPLSPEPMEPEERERLLRSHGVRAEMERTADAVVATTLDTETREDVIDDYLRVAPSAWRGWLEIGSREDLSELAGETETPTLVLVGESDPVMARDMLQREVVDRIRGARLEVIPDSGHLMPLENPAALAARLNAFSAERRRLPEVD